MAPPFYFFELPLQPLFALRHLSESSELSLTPSHSAPPHPADKPKLSPTNTRALTRMKQTLRKALPALAEQLAAEGWTTSTDKGQQANPVARLLRDARRG